MLPRSKIWGHCFCLVCPSVLLSETLTLLISFVELSLWEFIDSSFEKSWIGWNWPSGFGQEDFLFSSMYFRYFVIISLWKKAGPFFWTNMNPLHPRMLCAKFGWNWPSGSGEEDFLSFVNLFSLFLSYLPLGKGGALHLNKFDSPAPKDALCQVWLKLAQWFWRRSRK